MDNSFLKPFFKFKIFHFFGLLYFNEIDSQKDLTLFSSCPPAFIAALSSSLDGRSFALNCCQFLKTSVP
jgi:hypothetical protein